MTVGRFVATGVVVPCMLGAQAAALVHYEVPPMSDVKRLPDTPVADGVKGGTVRVILAKDEYEPGSFVIESLEDLGRVQLALTPFTNERDETLPADCLDLKVVKVWYQNRNAWNNYFGDTGFALCPELLLNDENLIRVDTAFLGAGEWRAEIFCDGDDAAKNAKQYVRTERVVKAGERIMVTMAPGGGFIAKFSR